MQELSDYSTLADDMAAAPKRWLEWINLERPEEEPMPGASQTTLL